MKHVSQNYKTGKIKLEDVEYPALKKGGVLVRTLYSLVSTGTEGMKVKEGKLSYLGKARARPDQVKKVINTVKQQGLMATYEKVMNKLDSLTPLGYSLAGEVVAVGAGAEEFSVGQKVVCAGAGYANHAEVNFIPKNLVVACPNNVDPKYGAFTTVGAIALQGFRQAELQLEETACVIGLGLLGQLLVQILKAAGVHVIGVDVVAQRCELAEEHGAAVALTPDDDTLRATVERITAGRGVDCIFITAGGASNGPTELAVDLARDRARIIDIGKTRLDLPWNDYYLKELDVRFSRSYGPGRYDPNYEERGIDYPIGYVRWTERRNMEAFVNLLAKGKLNLKPLVSSIRSFEEAEQVYQELADSKGDVLALVFEYSAQDRKNEERPSLIQQNRKQSGVVERVNLAAIGAGSYASSMLFPQLVGNKEANLKTVATTTGLSAQNAKRKFGFEHSTTNYKDMLKDIDIDAVIVATRHSSHAQLVAESIRAGKATYVEKPLALDFSQLEDIRTAIVEANNDRLMVGFNRRFSPMVSALAERFWKTKAPLVIHYRVHAGQLDPNSWYLDSSEGTRFVGEAGHFFDVISFIAGARPISVFASVLKPEKPTRDDIENIAATVRYENGSLGNILYLTQGAIKVPKEYLEIFGGGITGQLNNFESCSIFEGNKQTKIKSAGIDKGQRNEMDAFVRSVKTGEEMPISVDSLLDTTILTLCAMESLRTGREVMLNDHWVTQ